jgi:protocatechuate 3,4-dioxygenase beta subunit
MERRELLSVTAPALNVGATYYEPHDGTDSSGNLLYFSWNGGAPNTQLTSIVINTHKDLSVPQDANYDPTQGDAFFHTAPGGPSGTLGGVPFSIVQESGVGTVTGEVNNNSTLLTIHCTDFQSSGLLVIKINVDELQTWIGGQANPVVEGDEFADSHFTATFTAPHYQSLTVSSTYVTPYGNLSTEYGLNLPPDDYMPPSTVPEPVYTAGLGLSMEQTPLPITLSGTVFNDMNADNQQETGDLGIAGVKLSLYELDSSGNYVADGKTTTTDANGNYEFDGLLPSTYQVVETQPDGYLSVGDTPGTVNGATRGVVTTVDVLSSINLDGGDNSIHNNFAETRPATLSGYVYYDANNNGVMDAGEQGIGGVHLTVTNVASGQTADAYTMPDGSWYVGGLMPGQYKVNEDQPTGYLDGLDVAGTAGGAAHNPGDLIDGIQLVSGQSGLNYDFGELLPASVSGYVYVDANNNGIFDPGEKPIAGAKVALLDASGKATGATAVTDSSGFYQFNNLMPGTYGISETQPAGYLDGLDAAGTVGGKAHNPGDLIDGIPLASGQTGLNYDFGELLPASVSGYVYVDANNNGIFDPGEATIAGVKVTLLDAGGKATGATAVTDSSGFYQFSNLMPGTYGISESQPAGYLDGLDVAGNMGGTAHNPGDLIDGISLASGQAGLNYDFGELLPASISGYVYCDDNNNGHFDSGEAPIAGVTVTLVDASGNSTGQTATTDAAGYYHFDNLLPGTYGVAETQPAGYLDGLDVAGPVGGTAHNPGDLIDGIPLASGVAAPDNDFGEIKPASISGYVFQDGPPIVVAQGQTPDITKLRDGTLTPDDKRFSGIVLVLCNASGEPELDAQGNKITAVTDANGYYQFTNLKPDVYSIVEETQPANYVPGIDTAGTKNGVTDGLVFNSYTYKLLDAGTLSLLANLDSNSIAIAKITLDAGDAAISYNFSHVLVQTQSQPANTTPSSLPPIEPMPPMASPVALPFAGFQPPAHPYVLTESSLRPMTGGAAGADDFSWHLSIIDAGQPRRDGSGDQYAGAPQDTYFDPVSWSGADLNQSQWILADENGAPLMTVHFGMPGSVPVTGDWDGSGTTKVGVFFDGLWFLDLNGNGVWDDKDLWIKLGKKGDQPVAGDWNGDGKTDIGIFGHAWAGDAKAVTREPGLPDAQNVAAKSRPKNVPPDPVDAAAGYRTLKKGHVGKMRSDVIDHVFQYGMKGDVAVVGDWNGDGIYTVGIFRNGVWYLDMDGDGRWSEGDLMVEFGQEGDRPVVGDWTGDGISKLGVYRNGTFYLDTNNNHRLDATDKVFQLGGPGDKPVAGDWNGDGIDKVGVYRDGAVATPQTASAAGAAVVK